MTQAWPSKDPDAVYDYSYTIPLDDGDSVASATLSKLSGDVVIDSQGVAANVLTAVLSGGTDGETAVFQVDWSTNGGDADQEVITLAVNEKAPLTAPTGFVDPTAAELKAAFSRFADVGDPTVEFWLARARRSVDTSWTADDYGMGQMLLAAHYLTLEGYGTGAEAEIAGGGLAGMKSVKSGNFSFTKDEAGSSVAAGSFDSTSYGTRWLELLKQNKAGARVMPSGTLPDIPLYQGLN